MSEAANVKAIRSIEDLYRALKQFGSEAMNALQSAETEINKTINWLEERLGYWRYQVQKRQKEVYLAESALASCLSSGYTDEEGRYHAPNCCAYEYALLEARNRLREDEAELQNVKQWIKIVMQTVGEYRIEAHRLSDQIANEIPKATTLLERKSNLLWSYTKMQSSSGTIFNPGFMGSRLNHRGKTGWTKKGIKDVSIDQIDVSQSNIKGPDDFTKVTYEEVKEGFKKLTDVVQPAVGSGADEAYFSQLDDDKGLKPQQGYLAVYNAFYGTTAIKLDRVGEKFVPVNGSHRLFVARELGLKTVPAYVDSFATNMPPEFREGNIGGPEREH